MLKRLPKLGFTLIELLVVVAIISILAVLLIVAINPVEQLNKSRDGAVFQDADELNRALQRFYAANNCYPWDWIRATGCRAATQLVDGGGRTAVRFQDLTGAANPLDNYGYNTILDKLGSSTGGANEINDILRARIVGYVGAATCLTAPQTAGAGCLMSTLTTGDYITKVLYYPRSKTYQLKANFAVASADCSTAGTSPNAYVCVPGTAF